MTSDTPDGYRAEKRWVFTKEDSRLSDSRVHPGLKSPLARSASKDLSHIVVGDEITEGATSADSPVEADGPARTAGPSSSSDTSVVVPLALTAAGIAMGVAGVKVAQHLKSKREGEQPSSPPVTPSQVPAGWYGDPSDPAQLRYWDGHAWTHHVAPAPGAGATPPDWYLDPADSTQLRYWDGQSWTGHLSTRHGLTAAAPSAARALPSGHSEPEVTMSSAEWQEHVRAWAAATAIQQELWWRLSHARIVDADHAVLAAQHELRQLTAEQGTDRVRRMLEANPSLRDGAGVAEFLQAFVGNDTPGQAQPARFERTSTNRRRLEGTS